MRCSQRPGPRAGPRAGGRPRERATVNWFVRIREFLAEVWGELKKTTWPGRREVYGTTIVVIITVLLTAVYLYVVDLVLNLAVEQLFKGLRG